MELDKHAPPASPCVHYSRFHLSPSLSRSTISFNSTPLNFLPLVPRSPPTRCLVKMTECEDLMEYFLSSLWIRLLTDMHTHFAANVHKLCVHEHNKAHASCQGLLNQWRVMSLILVDYQWRDYYMLRQRLRPAWIFSWDINVFKRWCE